MMTDEELDEYAKFYAFGYEYGFDRTPQLVICYTDNAEAGYNAGVEAGTKDRQEVQRVGSSNT